MKVTTAALCEHARERDDGRLDLIGVFQRLHAAAFPAVQERMTAVIIIDWEAEEAGLQPLRADLLGPGNRRVLAIEGQTEVGPTASGAPAQTRLILPLEQVVFPEPGEYAFELRAGGRTLPVCPLLLGHHPAG